MKRKKQSGFGIIIAKTRGACVIARFWPNQEMGRDRDGLVLSPDFGQIRRWAVIEMGLERMHLKNW